MLVQELEKDSRSYFDENVEKKKANQHTKRKRNTTNLFNLYLFFLSIYNRLLSLSSN